MCQLKMLLLKKQRINRRIQNKKGIVLVQRDPESRASHLSRMTMWVKASHLSRMTAWEKMFCWFNKACCMTHSVILKNRVAIYSGSPWVCLQALLIVSLSFFAAACATVQNYRSTVNTWQGASKKELFRVWGLPDKEIVTAHRSDGSGTTFIFTDYLTTISPTWDEQIGKGKLDAEFTPLSDGDILGNALINMRKSLQENEKQDRERNWIVTGIAEISEILRSHNTIKELGEAVIAYLTEKIDAVQGAFYVVNDDEQDNTFIELKASYAYHKKKYLNGKFKFAQGLVGQVAAEKAGILRTEIPEDYVSITSGLIGEQRPRCILINPMITEEKVYGALEFAGVHRFSEMQIKFIDEISVIVARTIFNIKVNERTRILLEESQKMSNELQEQQEVLRQNAEEMASTQEELKRTNQRLEDQIEEVNRTQNRMQLLLENASEVISIYEEDGTIRYISPSVTKILGYSQNDMIGINDIKNVHKDYKEQYGKLFQAVIENPYESKTAQFEYLRRNGDNVWLEATATNLLSDKSIQGIIVNSRDITERRRAEQEERMRSKMQALSENSPGLITRLDHEGNIFYINPIIENYTGQKPSELTNKKLKEINIPDELKENWMSLLQTVEDNNEKVSTEMDFPSEMGKRVMQVNAIPEYDEGDKMESVLVVSHDITDRKLIELEIQSKNKQADEVRPARPSTFQP